MKIPRAIKRANLPSVLLAVVLCTTAKAEEVPSWSRAAASHYVLDDYRRYDCHGYLRTHSPYYRRTFARALAGDFKALRRVFFDYRFHSGDNESWEEVPGDILYVVGDGRFAKFLATLTAEERHDALIYINNAGFIHTAEEGGNRSFFRHHFPLTNQYYAAIWPQYRH